jgi:hypothetical protein
MTKVVIMTKEHEVLFKNLKQIKDKGVESSIKRLNHESIMAPALIDEDYEVLRLALTTEEEKIAYKRIVNDLLETAIHSILVMFDGGTQLTDEFNIDIINADTKKSLLEKVALHEEFIGYLLDVEEEES